MPYLAEALGGAPAILGFRSDRHAEAAASSRARGRRRAAARHRAPAGRSRRRARVRPGADARGRSRTCSRRAARLGGADGVRLRRLLRLRRRARRALRAPLRRGPGPAGRSVIPPILNASGCLDALTAPRSSQRLDAFVTKTVTPLPREGNPPPRIAETESGMLNSIGLQNPGIDAFVRDNLPRLAALGVPLWVSVGGFSADDYARALRAARRARRTSTSIELNLSCPNVEEAPETAAELVAAARGATRKAALREALAGDVGHRGVGARRRRRGRRRPVAGQHDPRPRARRATPAPKLARGAGGYSGPALRPIALACVYACAQAVDVPIVGMGGIASGRDVRTSSPPVRARSRSARSSSPIPGRRARARGARCGRGSARRDRGRPGAGIGRVTHASSDPQTVKFLQITLKRFCLTARASLVDSSGSWSRRSRTHRRLRAPSTRGWRRSSGRTTSESAARS